MNTKKTLGVFLFAFFLLPLMAMSGTLERYCFNDNFGNFYEFRGGKLGKKTYLVQSSNINCPATQLSGVATFAQVSGGYLLSSFVSGDPAGVCGSFILSMTVDSSLTTATGNYDNLPRFTPPDNAITLTSTVCLGPLDPVHVGPAIFPDGPGSTKQSKGEQQ